MAQMLLINPRRRKRRHNARRRSARRHVARNPQRRRRHNARPHRAMGYTVGHARIRRRRLNPRRHHRRVHRNPFHAPSLLKQEVMPAALGAVGAVGLDVIWGQLASHLPATLTGNVYLAAAAKGAGAVGLGFVAGKALGREKGRTVAIGALTVIAYELVSGLVKQMAPSLPLAGYGSLGAYMPGMHGFGAYMQAPALPAPVAPAQAMHGFGAYNPAPYLQGLGAYDASSDSMF